MRMENSGLRNNFIGLDVAIKEVGRKVTNRKENKLNAKLEKINS